MIENHNYIKQLLKDKDTHSIVHVEELEKLAKRGF